MRKTFMLLGACTLIAALLITCLFQLSKRLLESDNPFIRIFPPHPLGLPEQIDLKVNSYYFAGTVKDRLLLANTTAPAHFLTLNPLDFTTAVVKGSFPKNQRYTEGGLQSIGQSPYIYTVNSFTTDIFQAPEDSLQFKQLTGEWLTANNAFLPFSTTSAIIKSFDTSAKRILIKKISLQPIKQLSAYYPTMQHTEGIFSPDGMLLFNEFKKEIIYIHHYWNRIVCLDSNLNLVYTGKTIDTITAPQRAVINIVSQNRFAITGPSSATNVRSCISNGYLFVQSSLKAKNQTSSSMDSAWTIDVYKAEDSKYQFSFFIPFHEGSKPYHFQVVDNKLFVIYGRFLVRYPINHEYLHFLLTAH
jgi:hypothetical protein